MSRLTSSQFVDKAPPVSDTSISSTSDVSDSRFSWDADGVSLDGSNGGDNANAPNQASGEPALTPHDKHFHIKGMIDIRIEKTLFRVPRVSLAAYSEPFALLLEKHDERTIDEPLYIRDEDVKSAGFARLLDLVYPSKYGRVCLDSQEEWLSILHLSSKWSFNDLRTLSIKRLGSLPTTSAIDKLLTGRKYDVPHWVSEAYLPLCQRDEALSLEECERLTLKEVVKINEARHKARVYTGIRPVADVRLTVGDVLQSMEEISAPDTAKEEKARELAPLLSESSIHTSLMIDNLSDIPSGNVTFGPPDVPRFIRLMKRCYTSNGPLVASALKMLIEPYSSQDTTMDLMAKLVVQELPTSLYNPSTGYYDLPIGSAGQILLDVINPSCQDTTEQRSLQGACWIAQRMADYCYALLDGGKNLAAENARSVIWFLAWLNGTGRLSHDAFEPLWVELVRQIQEPQSSWSGSLVGFFQNNYSDIQTPANALLIDQFFDKIETLASAGLGCQSDTPLYGYDHSNVNSYCTQCNIPQVSRHMHATIPKQTDSFSY